MPKEPDLEIEELFSFKRYFINNVDTYHGMAVLNELSKILEKNAAPKELPSASTLGGEDAEPKPPPPPETPYEIYATVFDDKERLKENNRELEAVTQILPKDKKLVQQILTCGTVILDISADSEEVKKAMEYFNLLKALLERQTQKVGTKTGDDDDDDEGGDSKKRYLILISTVLTWGATKPLDPDNPELPFIETDFRKRKPHLNYKAHYDAENEVIGIARKYRSLIGATVVCSGMTYGGKEDTLYYWFQKAWECEKYLPIIGRGNNLIPIINVLDLAKIVYNLVIDFPKKLFILAVEQTPTKQREIVKPLGRVVGTGMFKCLLKEDILLIKEINQRIYDLMTLNLSMEPTFIDETMQLDWTSDLTFPEKVLSLMKQFRKARGLKSYKVVIYGPPIVGKTTLAKQMCDNYGLVLVSPETIIDEMLADLSWRVNHWDTQSEIATLGVPGGEEELPADDDEDMAADEEVQEAARNTLALLRSGRPLTDDEMLGLIRQRLLCHDALNRGWVLDGYPTNLAQCQQLFEKGEEQDAEGENEEEEGEEGFEEDLDLYSDVLKKLLPDVVVSLDATDDFICEKAMRQPEDESRLDEEVILRRLSEFRAGDTRENTPLNFFDEHDIHPLVINVNNPTDYAMKVPYANVSLRMGRPCRYPKLLEMVEENEKRHQRERDIARKKEEMILRELERKMKEEREDKMEYWSELYAMIREEEEMALAAAGEPMRNYLVHHIFPTLTPALLEVARLRPEDPIDFLAEYLFKLNPTGKMLEPGYNLKAEEMLGRIKLLDEALKGLDLRIDPLMPTEVDAQDQPGKHEINPMSAL